MWKYNFLSLILIFTCLAEFASAQNAQYYYQQGMQLKEQGKIDEAIKAFRSATARNNKFAEAYYQLGLLYLKKGGLSGKALAEEVLLRARRLETDSTKYLYALSELFDARMFYSIEALMFRRIVNDDTCDVNALSILADYYKHKMMQSYWDHYFVRDDYLLYTGNTVAYYENKEYANKKNKVNAFMTWNSNLRRMELYNNKLLAVDPNNRDGIFRKGLSFIERDSITKFINYFSTFLEKNPYDSDAHLFVGLGYGMLGKYDISYKQYQLAFSFMKPGDWKALKDNQFLNANEGYWKRIDPLFLTPYNERLIEQYNRIAEAQLRFSIPGKGINGWDTDEGRVWILFGRPLKIEGYKYGKQEWIYEDFSIMFDGITGFYWKWGISTDTDFDTIEWNYSDYFRFKSPALFTGLITDVVSFRGEENNTRTEIYYGIPVNKLKWTGDSTLVSCDLYTGVFICDNNWNSITQQADTVYVDLKPNEIDTTVKAILKTSTIFNLPPRNYNYSVEVLDLTSGNIGVYRSSVKLPDYRSDSLMISDILVANKADMIEPHDIVSRDNIEFDVNPAHSFKSKQEIDIYFEIYNLFVEKSTENNHYRLEYSIIPEVKEENEVKKFLKGLIAGGAQNEGISVSTEQRNTGRTGNHILHIAHSLSKSGKYTLTIRITDFISGQGAVKTVPILIY
jgi:GWxTD domain-containing protein